MREPKPIGFDEYMKELERVNSKESDGQTTEEIRGQLGIGYLKARALLKRAKAEGMLEITKKRMIALNGVSVWVSAYKITRKGK